MRSIGAYSRSVSAVAVVLVVMAVSSGCGGQKEEFDQRGAPAAASQTAAPAELFSNGNTLGIQAGVSKPSTFTVASGSVRLVGLTTYHYVGPSGVPATGTVGLKGADGKVYGPWPTTGSDGQGGIKNAFWEAKIDVVLVAGTYTVTDSDPSTWSSNSKSGGAGFFWTRGYALP
jgi:hypothetical protein